MTRDSGVICFYHVSFRGDHADAAQGAAVAVQIHDGLAEALVSDLLGLVRLTEGHGCFCSLEQTLAVLKGLLVFHGFAQ